MRFLLVPVLLVHALGHLIGFLKAWAPTRTTIVGDRLDLGVGGIKVVGLLWLAVLPVFVVATAKVIAGAPGWPDLTMAAACASLALCVLQLPDTKLGIAFNAAVIGLVLLVR